MHAAETPQRVDFANRKEERGMLRKHVVVKRRSVGPLPLPLPIGKHLCGMLWCPVFPTSRARARLQHLVLRCDVLELKCRVAASSPSRRPHATLVICSVPRSQPVAEAKQSFAVRFTPKLLPPPCLPRFPGSNTPLPRPSSPIRSDLPVISDTSGLHIHARSPLTYWLNHLKPSP
jgi:hypothetical protein